RLASYPHPERTIATYMATLGGPGSVSSFMALASRQARGNWNPALTARAVNTYLRDGPAPGGQSGCSADFDGDGAVTVNDFMAFMQAFSASLPAADVNRDGSLNLLDLQAFQREVMVGCP